LLHSWFLPAAFTNIVDTFPIVYCFIPYLLLLHFRLLISAFPNIYWCTPDYQLLHYLFLLLHAGILTAAFTNICWCSHSSWLFIADCFPINNRYIPKYLLLHCFWLFLAALFPLVIYACCISITNCLLLDFLWSFGAACTFIYYWIPYLLPISTFQIINCRIPNSLLLINSPRLANTWVSIASTHSSTPEAINKAARRSY